METYNRAEQAKKSRSKGHRLELSDVRFLKEKYPNIATSRSESKNMDNRMVDIVGTELGSFPYLWQCKNGYVSGIDYEQLIENMKALNPKRKERIIIHHKWGQKNMENLLIMQLWDLIEIVGNKCNNNSSCIPRLNSQIVMVPRKQFKHIL